MTHAAPDLAGIDLVVFDKDGTLIDFDTMWAGWAVRLARSLEAATGVPMKARLFAAIGFRPDVGGAVNGSPLGSHSMAELRRITVETVVASGSSPGDAETIVTAANTYTITGLNTNSGTWDVISGGKLVITRRATTADPPRRRCGRLGSRTWWTRS